MPLLTKALDVFQWGLKALFCAFLFSGMVHADSVGYSRVHHAFASNGRVFVKHYHNWHWSGQKKIDALFSNLQKHDNFFGQDNDFAYVEARDVSKGLLFKMPSPALTVVWVSPDSKYIVGLSNVMLYNPYQLVVWDTQGNLIHKQHISSAVVKMSKQQHANFVKLYPGAEKFLKKRYFQVNGISYLDCFILGVPNEIGMDAFKHLIRMRVRHPYSPDFSETVTNNVYWYNEKNPDIHLREKGRFLILNLVSPGGRVMKITFSRQKLNR